LDERRLTFGGDRFRIRILDHFTWNVSYSHRPIFVTVGKVTDADKVSWTFWQQSGGHTNPNPD